MLPGKLSAKAAQLSAPRRCIDAMVFSIPAHCSQVTQPASELQVRCSGLEQVSHTPSDMGGHGKAEQLPFPWRSFCSKSRWSSSRGTFMAPTRATCGHKSSGIQVGVQGYQVGHATSQSLQLPQVRPAQTFPTTHTFLPMIKPYSAVSRECRSVSNQRKPGLLGSLTASHKATLAAHDATSPHATVKASGLWSALASARSSCATRALRSASLHFWPY